MANEQVIDQGGHVGDAHTATLVAVGSIQIYASGAARQQVVF